VLAGFSFGADTAFLVAAKRPPRSLWLFSLLPRFAEDIPDIPEAHKSHMGPVRQRAFERYSFNETAPKITCETLIFMGSEESEWVRRRSENAHLRIPNSRLIIAEGARHDISSPSYLAAIRREI
jgi:pimeloyl-ACP methyl ester carboxylesterase